MKNIQIIAIIAFTLTSLISNAQDIHFSQFWNAPLLHNPSFAGNSDGSIRAVANYRSQWGSVTSNPFNTFGANFDMRFHTSPKGNHFAGGLAVYTDVAGEARMRTTILNLAASYHLKIDKQNYISGGIQAGFNQISIDDSDLRFDNQFDGIGHNPSISSNENFSNLSQIKPTVSAGVSYMWSDAFNRTTSGIAKKGKRLIAGFAVQQFNAPKFDFTEQERLGLRYIASFEGSFNISTTHLTIEPAAFLAVQNKATDIVFGSLFKYAFNEGSQITGFRKSISIGLGGYYRLKDAIIPTFQIEWASFNIGVSYDVNLSQLSPASKGRGGFEISLKYVSLNSVFGGKSRARYNY